MKEQEIEVLDFSGKSLMELSELLREFAGSEDRLQKPQVADEIKKAFYRTLLHEKEKAKDNAEDAFDSVEESFKEVFAAYRKEKAEYNREMERQRENNLAAKNQVIEDLKSLLEKDENIGATIPEFRSIQARWRETGPVPAANVTDINKTYQLYVEQFYDKLNINRELRDLDFKKNMEAKTALCERAEELGALENCIEAFKELQKLHEAWKDLGPVAAQYREEVWERFKTASAVVNKKYQTHFEGLKEQQEKNLEAKRALCEQVEAIAKREISDSRLWNSLTSDIEGLQAQWKTIGFATHKENQAVYDRFRAACNKFFERKRMFYAAFKDDLEANLKKKEELCEKAEELKSSTDWKATSEAFRELQKIWKETGAVPRKKSDAVWKRFRTACDEFFDAREKSSRPVPKRGTERSVSPARSGKEALLARYRALEQEIATQENNIMFFSVSKGSDLIDKMRASIEAARKELKELEQQIKG